MHMALTVHLLKNGLYSVGNEEKLNPKYLTSYFYIPNIIFTVLDVINSSLFLEVFKRKLLFMYKTHMQIAINNNDLTKFEKEWSQFLPLVNSIDT